MEDSGQEDLVEAVILDLDHQEVTALAQVVQGLVSDQRVHTVLRRLDSFNLLGVVAVVSVLVVSHLTKDLEVNRAPPILLMVHQMPVVRVLDLRTDLAVVLKAELVEDNQVEEAGVHHHHHTVLLVLVVVLVAEALLEAAEEILMETNLT